MKTKSSLDQAMTEKKIQNALWTFLVQKGHRPVIPNFTPAKWWECDMFSVTSSGYGYEFEIKITKSDFKADSSKSMVLRPRRQLATTVRKHDMLAARNTSGPSRFSYVTPTGLLTLDDIPEWAGLYEVDRTSRGRTVVRCIKQPPQLHKEKVVPEVLEKIRDAFMWRFWSLREKLYN